MSITERYLRHLFHDAHRVELRHDTGSQWVTTWHNDPDDLLITARAKAGAGNLYTSLHHIGTWGEDPLGNDGVDRFTRIFFDLDPDRPAKTSSTEAELADARTRAQGLQRHLSAHGWPIPAIGMSGNGYHLQYRVALPNTPETNDMLRALYAGLARRFGDDVVTLDQAVKNAGRICCLYGSIKRKGENTEDRPHRKSDIVIPFAWDQVRAKDVEKLAEVYAQESTPAPAQTPTGARSSTFARGEGNYRTLDVVNLFMAHSAYVRPIAGNMHAVRCPWIDEHSTASPPDGADTVIFEADHSWPGFHCKHSHCIGRGIREVIAIWPDADQFCRETFVKSTGFESSGGQCHV